MGKEADVSEFSRVINAIADQALELERAVISQYSGTGAKITISAEKTDWTAFDGDLDKLVGPKITIEGAA